MASILNDLLILLKLQHFFHWPDQNFTGICPRASDKRLVTNYGSRGVLLLQKGMRGGGESFSHSKVGGGGGTKKVLVIL